MKILVLVVLPFIAMTSFSFGNNYADSTKEEHNLQRRCDEDAKQHFERYYGTGYYKSHGSTSLYHYTSHYNRKLNKCFVMLMGELIPYNVEEMGKHGVTTNNELWDIIETRVQ
jgi:hypothetical protein